MSNGESEGVGLSTAFFPWEMIVNGESEGVGLVTVFVFFYQSYRLCGVAKVPQFAFRVGHARFAFPPILAVFAFFVFVLDQC